MVVGIRQTSSAMSTEIDDVAPRINGEGLQGDDDQQEDDGQPDQQNIQRDLVRRFLPRGAFHQRDHPVEEGLAGFRGDQYVNAVGEHFGAAGHRAAVAAAFANHRRGFAGDGRFIDRGNAFDHLTVAGDNFPRRDAHHVAFAQLRGGQTLISSLIGDQVGRGLGAHPAQRIRLRFAAPLRHRLGKIGEEHGEPEPGGDVP